MDGPTPRCTPEVANNLPQPRPLVAVALECSHSGRRASRSARRARSIWGVYFMSSPWCHISSIFFANAADPPVDETPPVAQEVRGGRAVEWQTPASTPQPLSVDEETDDADGEGERKRLAHPTGPSTL